MPRFLYLATLNLFFMSEKKTNITPSTAPLFTKDNYLWMIIGIVVIIIGMLLMAGGKSSNANEFNMNEVYSFRRITLAPIVIVIGLGLQVYAIFKKPKSQQ